MDCSLLNYHRYCKNIVPSPYANAVPSKVRIILFQCARYSEIKNTYLQKYLYNHFTHDLLYGKDMASNRENVSLFLDVQEFILKVKAFWLNIKQCHRVLL